MIDRSLGAVGVTATRIGRTELGQATALVDDEGCLIVVRISGEEKRVRIPLSYIEAIGLSTEGDELTLVVREGAHVVLTSPAARQLSEQLNSRCRALPELTRALRTFGSRRGVRTTRANAAAEQQRFFAPLLSARKAGAGAIGAAAMLAAFDATALATACEGAVHALVEGRHAEPGPARRALEAELVDLSEPLIDSIRALGAAAADAGASIDDLQLWRAWAAQLRATFEVADRVWISMDAALDGASLRS